MNRFAQRSLNYVLLSILLQTCRGTTCKGKVRVIADTDIGDDIDDTWALGALLANSNVDLRLVVADSYSSERRAQILARFLSSAGAATPPIGIGPNRFGKELVLKDWAGSQDIQRYKGLVHEDAAKAIIDEVALGAASNCSTVVMVLSPCTALADALQQAPWIARHAYVVAMGGSIWHGNNGTGPPYPEWNIAGDVASAQTMYAASWNITTAPLDTAGAAQVSGAAFGNLLRCKSHSSIVKAIFEMYADWLPACPWPAATRGPFGPADLMSTSSVLYDALAAMLLTIWDPRSFVDLQTVKVHVAASGRMLVDPERGVPIIAATHWRSKELWQNSLVTCLCAHGKTLIV